ncbi:ABC-type branched-chain amino acid transport system, ATPase component [Halorhabdus sp. SVX81]|uniref:ABC transporter ATP-binding protein n=1 Tax=Halorhabdus sp. SVX81 TaxID=2978283 RepID=UPI0023DA31E7|nr:ABC transporter ATP-binding protein [Halorhabdus sp. SVX81]WEL18378.1 ABC-type branched-chain amino acid transport system, ATPase component [Halorhabdus sp. SVX81]
MLTCNSLTVAYDATPILRNVDLTVEDGEIVGIIGKNGAGKTTLLKAIIGLLDARSGTIEYRGTPVGRLTPDERAARGIGYIPQGRDVFPELTVEQNLVVGESINDGAESRYEAVYDYFPVLEERADQAAGTLSGGQRQMLAIGRALVGNPDLLLLDEPSEGVQPSIVEQISEDMRAINADLGTTILFVEQNLGVIQSMADRCYAMERGTIADELDGAAVEDEDTVASYLAV